MHTALSLRDLQRQFMTALHDADAPGPVAAIAGNGLTAAGRLRIYRSMCDESHLEALRLTYPALCALVGDAFFKQTARGYRRAHPPRSGNLQEFGAELPDYIETLPGCGAYPYLSDVARLEWLRQETILAPGATSAAPVDCVERALTGLARLRASLQPSLHLLRSAYPVLHLWRYALHPSPEPPALGDGECVALWREDGEVAMGTIDPATFACIAALQQGSTLAGADAAALAVDPDFDISMCVGTLLERNLVAGLAPLSHGDNFNQPDLQS